MNFKNVYRLAFLGLLAFFAFTCNVTEVGPDTLNFSVGDSLKYPNYDSLQLHVFVIPTPKDTTFRKVAFHGRYDSAAQLKHLILGKLPSSTFIVVVKAFRKNMAQLVVGVNFIDGKVGKIDTILLPTDTTHRVNHRPLLSLVSPDNGKTVFSVSEGATLAFNLAVKDTDAGDAGSLQPLTGSYCGAMTLDTAMKSFSFKPAYACLDSSGDSLVYNLELKAKDRGIPALWDTLKLQIVVHDKETAPRWKNTQPTVNGKEGLLMSLALDSLFLGDDEGDSVSFTASQGMLTTSPLVWSFIPGFSRAGQDTVYVTATDHHKPAMSSKLGIKLIIADSVRAIDVVITYPPNGLVTRDTQVTVSWKVNGNVQTNQLTASLPLEGQNRIRRFYRDSTTGDTASNAVMVIRDQLPPSKPVVMGPGLTNNPKPNWHWHSGGNNGVGLYRFKLDDKNLTDTNGVVDTTFTPGANLAEGTHKLYVQERDAVGNWSALDSSGIARIDVTAPNAPVFATKPLSPLNSLQPIWTWSGDAIGGMGSYRVKLDDSSLTSGATLVNTALFKPTSNLTVGPHILYVQEMDSAGNWSAKASKVLVLSLRGYLGAPGFTVVAAEPKIVISPTNGLFYVVFSDYGYSNKATVMQYNGTNWVVVGSPGFTSGPANDPTLRINSTGLPEVAYLESGIVSTYAFNGTNWEGQFSVPFNVTTRPSFSYILNNHVAAYSEPSLGNLIRVFHFANRTYLANPGVGTAPNLSVSQSAMTYITYLDSLNQGKISVKRYNDSLWESVGPAGFATGEYPCVTIGKNSIPYVAFYDAPSRSILIKRLIGSAWEDAGEPILVLTRKRPSLAVNSDGTPYVAYMDEDHLQKASVYADSFDP